VGRCRQGRSQFGNRCKPEEGKASSEVQQACEGMGNPCEAFFDRAFRVQKHTIFVKNIYATHCTI
jgi:hypothetical protein